ncbi:hypothetical protein EMCRGX_G013941 [Ephydatia muelleri]
MMMHQMLFVLFVLRSYVVTATIAPGYALQEHLCSGQLELNTNLVLSDGEHRISSGPPCHVSTRGNISIVGSSMKNTTVHCEGEGRVFEFISAQTLSTERITFINCGIHLISIENILITDCTFQDRSNTTIFAESVNNRSSIKIEYCLFINNNGYYGGGVWLNLSTGNVSISNCTFQNNTATFGGGVRLLLLTGNVSISHCTFQNNTATYGDGVSLQLLIGNVSISHCTFQNNSGGGGVSLRESTGDVSISHCTFQNNTATYVGGGVSLQKSTGDVSISHCTFQNNTATYGGGVSLQLLNGNVSISHCTFQNNTATYGGGVSLRESNGHVSISHCTFHNNTATTGGGGGVSLWESTGDVSISHCSFQNTHTDGGGGGGGVSLYSSTGDVSISHCTFQNNTAGGGGGGVSFHSSTGDVSISHSTFQNNIATIGGGVVRLLFLDVGGGDFGITNCTFQNNRAINAGGAVFSWVGVLSNILNSNDMELNGKAGDVNITKCSFQNNRASFGGAIFVVSVRSMLISGSTFTNNTAIGGAAVYAVNSYNSFIIHYHPIFTLDTEPFGHLILQGVMVKDNLCSCNDYDELRGGAIYFNGMKVDIFGSTFTGSQFSSNSPLGAIQGTNGYLNLHGNITFSNNTGVNGGAISLSNNVPLYFYEGCAVEFSRNAATGFGGALYNAGDKEKYHGKVITYPGRTVRFNVTSVDEENYLSPSVVYTQIDTNGITSPKITLGPTQKAQWIGTVCGTMEYQIYGPQMASLKLLLSNYPSNTPTVVEVTLLPCEPGFTLISNSSTGVMECSCSEFFTSFRVVCDASDGTVTRNKPNWIGVYNSTHPALASSCPMDYCNSAIDKVSLARPGDLCNGGRTGIICGSCHGNHSVVFGSSQCMICSNMWLITLVMFAVLGALLVAALFFLNFTVTQGTLYGLIFYANIIQINSSIFFHQAIPSLQIIVSFINLDLGIPMCFYNGMDDADKAGLQFVFPAYLLILTLTVIVICHYCLQRSPNTSTSSCLYRFPIIIGERAVGVLCTLIYLSYYKLLRTVIDIFTYSTVHLPSGDMNVWFYDGNVEYLQGKHATLFIIAVMTCTLFLLPYTFALTFIPIIEQYSEHNRLFNYLHKLANKFKPVNDAHYAPYKGEWRWWLGARLWLVVVMYSLNPVYSSDNPSLLLSIQATLVMLFMLVQANIQPFEQPLQKMDKCNRHTSAYNKLYNCLDLMYLLNYTALAMSMSYILGKSSNETQISVSVLVGLYVAMLLVTVLYHFIVAILKACSTYDRAKEKINGIFERKYEVMVPTELEESTTYTVSTTTVTVTNHLREPLCED